jgi:acetyl/propionyl-CoA carboxylase alpha subunit
MATTVLVANRGEIALRVFRTAKRMGMRTVAVYSDADAASPHVRAADEAVRLGPAPAVESYLRRDAIVEAARRTGATLIHPGYGFLSEDDAFAKDCEDAGLTFVGPPSSVLRIVGDKAASRALAEEAGVPVFAGYGGADQSDDALRAAATAIGFPVIMKPSAGGGGKGMAIVRDPDQLHEAIASARRIASAAFGDDRMILERYVDGPRHVEVQIFGDTSGNVVHLFERDCSLQRRHQKVLEESPAPNLAGAIREQLHEAGVAFAKRAGYVGAGTCEFLVSADGDFGFIEMNARLQVEHPVTELVTGLDLVEWQLRVALGERLPTSEPRTTGHAIEVRVYAEDPEHDSLPQAGRIEHLVWPGDVRVDAGVEQGTEVSTHYDPLLAKLVVHGPDRGTALEGLRRALASTEVLGPRTNLTFLGALAADEVVAAGTVTTDWLEHAYADWKPERSADVLERALAIAASAEVARTARDSDPWTGLRGWRIGGAATAIVVLRTDAGEHAVRVERPATGPAVWSDGRWLVWSDGAQFEFDLGIAQRRTAAGPARLDSPLPGQVIAVRVATGDAVKAGDELVVVEAMKMEHSITAPSDGTVRAVLCSEGDQVDRGQALVDLESA